jgi:hypothetical protein
MDLWLCDGETVLCEEHLGPKARDTRRDLGGQDLVRLDDEGQRRLRVELAGVVAPTGPLCETCRAIAARTTVREHAGARYEAHLVAADHRQLYVVATREDFERKDWYARRKDGRRVSIEVDVDTGAAVLVVTVPNGWAEERREDFPSLEAATDAAVLA